MSNFIDNDISLFINNKNKDKFFKDFNDNLKDKKRDFNDNFNNITVSFFTGIENNISICYKFQNDFNDYFQDKNNKNINDYKSIFVSVKNNISIYIVEVPNETAPSIQGFAKPPLEIAGKKKIKIS